MTRSSARSARSRTQRDLLLVLHDARGEALGHRWLSSFSGYVRVSRDRERADRRIVNSRIAAS